MLMVNSKSPRQSGLIAKLCDGHDLLLDMINGRNSFSYETQILIVFKVDFFCVGIIDESKDQTIP